MNAERILIVEDEPLTRGTMRGILEREGYHVSAVGSLDGALREAKKEKFNVVLADIVMANNGGLNLVEELRAMSPEVIPLLIIGGGNIETARAAMRIGICDFIMKPFEGPELCAGLAKALRRRHLIEVALHRQRLIDEALRRRQADTRNSVIRHLAGLVRHKTGVSESQEV